MANSKKEAVKKSGKTWPEREKDNNCKKKEGNNCKESGVFSDSDPIGGGG
ncbi:MAG: hypothetical protein ABFD08_13325 [Syntrophomonas sp.]